MLQPEVAGGFGPDTKLETRGQSENNVPSVSYLDYRFDGWLGDELLETYPCFIVTESLAQSITQGKLTGVRFAEVKTSTSEEFRDLHPNDILPLFRRLLPQGTVRLESKSDAIGWSGQDLCLAQRSQLVVTERALEILRGHHLDHCKISELKVSHTG